MRKKYIFSYTFSKEGEIEIFAESEKEAKEKFEEEIVIEDDIYGYDVDYDYEEDSDESNKYFIFQDRDGNTYSRYKEYVLLNSNYQENFLDMTFKPEIILFHNDDKLVRIEEKTVIEDNGKNYISTEILWDKYEDQNIQFNPPLPLSFGDSESDSSIKYTIQQINNQYAKQINNNQSTKEAK
ncbi:MAG: hypothetical protein LBH46_04395 [Rickettsiales bacterium]|jgi:hypothetical protein|nr:hypothetical protein [Rickettsiales bacterium]